MEIKSASENTGGKYMNIKAKSLTTKAETMSQYDFTKVTMSLLL